LAKNFVFDAQSYLDELKQMQDAIVPICKMGLYDGARAALDAVLAEIDNIPDRRYTNSGMARGLTKSDKDDLRAGLGISRMRDVDGQVSVKIGFDGYGSHRTPTWPNGVPVAMIARAICRGTSWLEKYDFISKAIRKSRAQIESGIANRIDSQIQKTIGANNK
jgi:hypothetical protein